VVFFLTGGLILSFGEDKGFFVVVVVVVVVIVVGEEVEGLQFKYFRIGEDALFLLLSGVVALVFEDIFSI
jgi:hypothetical protein